MAEGTVRPSHAEAFAFRTSAGFKRDLEFAVKARAEVWTPLGRRTRNREKSGGCSGSKKRGRPRKAAAFPPQVVHGGSSVEIPVVVDSEVTGNDGMKKTEKTLSTKSLELPMTGSSDGDLRLHKLLISINILLDGAEVMFFVHGQESFGPIIVDANERDLIPDVVVRKFMQHQRDSQNPHVLGPCILCCTYRVKTGTSNFEEFSVQY